MMFQSRTIGDLYTDVDFRQGFLWGVAYVAMIVIVWHITTNFTRHSEVEK